MTSVCAQCAPCSLSGYRHVCLSRNISFMTLFYLQFGRGFPKQGITDSMSVHGICWPRYMEDEGRNIYSLWSIFLDISRSMVIDGQYKVRTQKYNSPCDMMRGSERNGYRGRRRRIFFLHRCLVLLLLLYKL